jgi:hypothetical protein
MNAEPCFEPRKRRITASYRRLQDANAGAALVADRLGIDVRRLQVIGILQRRELADTLEPEGERAFWRAFARAHLHAGATGLACGIALWVACVMTGVGAITTSPALSAVAFALIGTFVGLVAAVLLLLRPGEPQALDGIRKVIAEGRWIVTVRTDSAEEERRIAAVLAASGGRTVVQTSARGWRRAAL